MKKAKQVSTMRMEKRILSLLVVLIAIVFWFVMYFGFFDYDVNAGLNSPNFFVANIIVVPMFILFFVGLIKIIKDWKILIPYKKKTKFGYRKGLKVVIEPIYDKVSFFLEGIAKVELDGKWFFINIKGERVEKE